MDNKTYDVTGIGSALLDITLNVDDLTLNNLGLKKGVMHLVNQNQTESIFNKIASYERRLYPGGSSSNTLAGVAFLGGKAAFFGKIGNDDYGLLYEKITKESGVSSFLSKHDLEKTGFTITLITPDYERTFAVHLGAAVFLIEKDFIEQVIKDSKILHLEAYQIENKELLVSLQKLINLAKKSSVKISLDLSDKELVKRNKDFLKEFIKNSVDIVFANETEAQALTGKNPEYALDELSKLCDIAIVKLGEKGSLIKSKNKIYKIPGYKTNVMNTNGAGDMYAAGILFGICNGFDFEKSGKLASYSASLVVSSEGARLNKEDKEKINDFLNSLNKSI